MLTTIKANKDLLFETNPLVNMKRNINDEEITKKTDDEGNGVDEQLYHPFILILVLRRRKTKAKKVMEAI
jgi:hypothetical protein